MGKTLILLFLLFYRFTFQPMIISKIIGGLGNQLFQYAAGRCLAIRHQTELLLDLNELTDYKLNSFDLNAFHTIFQQASEIQTATYYNRGIIEKFRDRLLPMALKKVYREPHFHFHPRFFNASESIYLKGYWQSEKYFAPVANQIRNELQFKDTYINKVKDLGEQIRNTTSVSVHIRRGDYTNKEILKVHGLLPPSYYEQSIKFLSVEYPGSIFYFFSDDINWVKETFGQDNAVYVSGQYTQTHFEDMYLMSQCHHNVIANSSFSWWGAWLNNNPGKRVIAPKNWFNTQRRDTSDLYPEGWLIF